MKVIIYTVDNLKKKINGVASLVLVFRIFHTQIVPEKKNYI